MLSMRLRRSRAACRCRCRCSDDRCAHHHHHKPQATSYSVHHPDSAPCLLCGARSPSLPSLPAPCGGRGAKPRTRTLANLECVSELKRANDRCAANAVCTGCGPVCLGLSWGMALPCCKCKRVWAGSDCARATKARRRERYVGHPWCNRMQALTDVCLRGGPRECE